MKHSSHAEVLRRGETAADRCISLSLCVYLGSSSSVRLRSCVAMELPLARGEVFEVHRATWIYLSVCFVPSVCSTRDRSLKSRLLLSICLASFFAPPPALQQRARVYGAMNGSFVSSPQKETHKQQQCCGNRPRGLRRKACQRAAPAVCSSRTPHACSVSVAHGTSLIFIIRVPKVADLIRSKPMIDFLLRID